MDEYGGWGTAPDRELDFHGYVNSIAHARYVMRRVLRILDEQAREHGLEPLQHQALLQVYGSPEPAPVHRIAERLGIAAAFASRLLRQLEKLGYVERRSVASDRRVVHVVATPAGIECLRVIDSGVHAHVRYFQSQLTNDGKLGALGIFAFYLGLDGSSQLAAVLRGAVAADREGGT